jgi:hypothetical protein
VGGTLGTADTDGRGAFGDDDDGADAGGALGCSDGVEGVEGLALGVVEHAHTNSGTHTRRASSLIGRRTTRDLDQLLRDL